MAPTFWFRGHLTSREIIHTHRPTRLIGRLIGKIQSNSAPWIRGDYVVLNPRSCCVTMGDQGWPCPLKRYQFVS